MNTNLRPIRAVLTAALLCASQAAAAPARSLYAAPSGHAASAEPATASGGASPSATAGMEAKFRKLQQELKTAPAAPGSPKDAATAGAAPAESVSMGGLALQILAGLVVVLILAVATIRILKRLQGRVLSRPGAAGGLLEVLETCHLGPQQRVVALRMHDEIGVVGVSKEGVALLAMLKQPAAEILGARRAESNSAAFSDNLNKLLDRFKKPKKVSDLLDEAEA